MGVKNTDITISKNDGIVAWPTIVAFAESPKKAGVLYAGTDDGNLSVSKDAGKNWTNVFSKIPDLPKGIYVSRVIPSRFDDGTVYATFDGHRQNDFETYVYASTDYGQTWRSIAANLKGDVVVKTLTEDLKNPDVLYLGTETGLAISVDRGKSWSKLKSNLPIVRVDEITLHPRDNAMVARDARARDLDPRSPRADSGVRGRAGAAADAKLFTPPPSAMYRRPASDRNYEFWGDSDVLRRESAAGRDRLVVPEEAGREVKLKITDAAGHEVREISGTGAGEREQGRHRVGVLGSARAADRRRRQRTPAAAAGAVARGGAGRRARRREPANAAESQALGRRATESAAESVRRRLRRRRRPRRLRRTRAAARRGRSCCPAPTPSRSSSTARRSRRSRCASRRIRTSS